MSDPTAALRYVVLRHEGIPEPHFDLMFESEPGGELVTFRSDVWPLEPQTRLVRIGAHRRTYLDYEGPVSSDRGSVRRVASGTFEWLTKGRMLTLVRLIETDSTWMIGNDPEGDGAVAIRA